MGQKNGQVYQWAAKGTRPRQTADQRYENAYIFGAVCPALDKGAALVMPHANTEASCRRHASSMMQKHLEEISLSVAAKAHGVVIMPLGDCWQSPAGDRPCRLAQIRRTENPGKPLDPFSGKTVHWTLFFSLKPATLFAGTEPD